MFPIPKVSNSNFTLFLQIFSNDYYGGNWASFNLHTVADWVEKVSAVNGERNVIDRSLVKDGEELFTIGKYADISEVEMKWHLWYSLFISFENLTWGTGLIPF